MNIVRVYSYRFSDPSIAVTVFCFFLMALSIVLSVAIFATFAAFPLIEFSEYLTTPLISIGKSLIVDNSSIWFYNFAAAVHFKNAIIIAVGLIAVISFYSQYQIEIKTLKRNVYLSIYILLYFLCIYISVFTLTDEARVGRALTSVYAGNYFRGVFMYTFASAWLNILFVAAISTCISVEKKRA